MQILYQLSNIKPGRNLLIASTLGNGFIVPEDDVIANTRKGKQVLNVKLPVEAFILCGGGWRYDCSGR